MKQGWLTVCFWWFTLPCYSWGFYAHQRINELAVFLLPPELLQFYKPHLSYLVQHAVDPDKRRYAVAQEGARHFIDLDHYGVYPFTTLPRNWTDAVSRYSADTLQRYGLLPWWIPRMELQLTEAFRVKNVNQILKISAEIGHYLSDAHVPLHTTSNHNGQFTGQTGIHGFWESRVPELLADEWNFFLPPVRYIPSPQSYIWDRILESTAEVDSVLRIEQELTRELRPEKKYSYEVRKGKLTRSYSPEYTRTYHQRLAHMVERRMKTSVITVSSFWYTAWINAGQPELPLSPDAGLSPSDRSATEQLDRAWRKGKVWGKRCEEE